MVLDVRFSCAGSGPQSDLQSLREWLPKADPSLPLRFTEPGPRSDRLGVSLDDLCAVIGATADLAALGAAVRGWVRNRFGHNTAAEEPVIAVSGPVTRIEVGPVTITITDPSAESGPAIGSDAR